MLLFVSFGIKAQQTKVQEKADSISYQYFLANQWNELIHFGDSTIKSGIDFKRLRQRMGYAYYAKADYYHSQKQYEKAYKFDKKDADTNLYLYFCGLYLANETYARFHAGKLSEKVQAYYGIKPVKIIDAIDVEYNYKIAENDTRSNPEYMRAGINTKLGYRLNLYQTFSNYKQYVNSTVPTIQNEYYANLSIAISQHNTINLAYHYLNTAVDTSIFPGNLVFAKYHLTVNRFDFGLSGSLLNNSMGNFGQLGFQTGISLPGKLYPYLKSSVYQMVETGNNRLIFSQSVGALFFKTLWLEGNITLGNLKNYADMNALYIYNSLDATTFRSGATLFWYAGKKFTFFANYTFDKKHIDETNTNYNQHSFSGGLIWKI